MSPKILIEKPGPLLVRGLNWLGDAVMSFPALVAVAGALPGRRIVVLARPGSADAYAGLGCVSEVLTEDRSLSSRLSAAKRIRALAPSGALVLPNSFSSAFFAFLTGAPVRVGTARNLRSPLLTRPVGLAPREEAAHECFRFLRLAEELGLKAPFSRPSLEAPPLPPGMALPAGLRLAVAPGAAFGGAKRWPAEHFAQTARLILEGRQGGVVILGGPAEAGAARMVEEGLSPGTPVLNLAGRTRLGEAMAVLARCHLTLSNDSGLMHLSGALDVPVVAVFGPTNPVRTSPLARRLAILRHPAPCSPCSFRECPRERRICFDDLTPREVAQAAAVLLSPVERSRRQIFWSPTDDQAWPDRPPRDFVFFSPAAEIAKAGGKPASAPAWVKVIWKPLEDVNDWRGLIHEYRLDPSSSFWLGDDGRHVRLARSLGGRSVLVMTGRARGEMPALLAEGAIPDLAAPDLARAMEWMASV
ncbi:MAG: lipopolysaccharide heptosyltransferase II [Deltaproteobacteria bacterium]|jgi:heptosyltransferase-2|nr:lipopolysaccharide heptosyltransferase II [Deltaproteobacteria bacterium]